MTQILSYIILIIPYLKIKQEKKIATPDSIIAATAINKNLIIVTRNQKDFEEINGLQIYNPFNK